MNETHPLRKLVLSRKYCRQFFSLRTFCWYTGCNDFHISSMSRTRIIFSFPIPLLATILAGIIVFTAGVSVASAATYTSTYTISDQNGVTIDSATFNNTSGGTCLKITSSYNIIIRNSTFTNCGMDGSAWSRAIVVYDSDNITIEHNDIYHVAGGMYIQGAARGKTYSNIKINYNRLW